MHINSWPILKDSLEPLLCAIVVTPVYAELLVPAYSEEVKGALALNTFFTPLFDDAFQELQPLVRVHSGPGNLSIILSDNRGDIENVVIVWIGAVHEYSVVLVRLKVCNQCADQVTQVLIVEGVHEDVLTISATDTEVYRGIVAREGCALPKNDEARVLSHNIVVHTKPTL